MLSIRFAPEFRDDFTAYLAVHLGENHILTETANIVIGKSRCGFIVAAFLLVSRKRWPSALFDSFDPSCLWIKWSSIAPITFGIFAKYVHLLRCVVFFIEL
jgi:hypothetical protein